MRRVPCTDPWKVESHTRCIKYLFSSYGLACFSLELILRVREPEKRMNMRRQLARQLTAPPNGHQTSDIGNRLSARTRKTMEKHNV
jgi:hypothetical protein